MPAQRLNRPPKLIANVQFMRVKQQHDPVHSLGKPLQHTREFVAAIDALLLSTKNTWGEGGEGGEGGKNEQSSLSTWSVKKKWTDVWTVVNRTVKMH